MKKIIVSSGAMLFIFSAAAMAEKQRIWDTTQFFKPPKTFSTDQIKFDFKVPPNVKPIFLEGPDYQGKKTRIFAWYGLPGKSNGKIPGVVLVHGSGGTAFATWVKKWTDRGYGAIAVDTSGNLPLGPWETGEPHGRKPHAEGGPGENTWSHVWEPIKDQWPYHAVATIMQGNSFLRSLPGIDADNIGVIGVSMGGDLVCTLGGVDPRFKFAVSIYGCGFLGEGSAYMGTFKQMDETEARNGTKWLTLWDPSHYLNQAKMPMLFVKGTNDVAFWNHSWDKSCRLPTGYVNQILASPMWHSHGCADIPEVAAFADQITKGALPLPQVIKTGRGENQVWADFESKTKITQAKLFYTTESGNNPENKWGNIPAQITGKKITAALPDGVCRYFFVLTDSRNYTVSSKLENRKD